MKEFGIDVSRWQGNFNFSAAIAEGVKFVIIKGGGGDSGLYVDSKFSRNYAECKKLNLPIGCYWFSKALTVAAAIAEADYFYKNVLEGLQFELPVYIDVENKTQLAVGKRLLTDIVKAFCNRLESKKYWVGIYSSKSYFTSYMYDAELTQYAHWVAQWSSALTYTPTPGMWQFGGETNKIRTNQVAGQTCDQDYMLFDYPSAIKAAGLNGFSKAVINPTVVPPAPIRETENEIAYYIYKGTNGWMGVNGQDRINKLQSMGYDPERVQAKVNMLVKGQTPPTPKPPAPAKKAAGDELYLSKKPLYASATTKKSTKTVSGTYYLYDGEQVNGRRRITNAASRVGKRPIAFNVTGWVAL